MNNTQIINGENINSYTPFHWENGFTKWNTVRIDTPRDGSCLFHAILNSYFIPYHTGRLNDTIISKKELVRSLRKQIADKLSQPIDPLDQSSPIYYDILSYGKLREEAEVINEYSLSNMQKILDSDSFVGYGYLELISDLLNKDIYILDNQKQNVYITTEDYLHKGRNSIVLLYIDDNHFELVGLLQNDGSIISYFDPNNPFIKFLSALYDYRISYR